MMTTLQQDIAQKGPRPRAHSPAPHAAPTHLGPLGALDGHGGRRERRDFLLLRVALHLILRFHFQRRAGREVRRLGPPLLDPSDLARVAHALHVPHAPGQVLETGIFLA